MRATKNAYKVNNGYGCKYFKTLAEATEWEYKARLADGIFRAITKMKK